MNLEHLQFDNLDLSLQHPRFYAAYSLIQAPSIHLVLWHLRFTRLQEVARLVSALHVRSLWMQQPFRPLDTPGGSIGSLRLRAPVLRKLDINIPWRMLVTLTRAEDGPFTPLLSEIYIYTDYPQTTALDEGTFARDVGYTWTQVAKTFRRLCRWHEDLQPIRVLVAVGRIGVYLLRGGKFAMLASYKEEDLLEAVDAWKMIDSVLAHPSFATTLVCVKIEFDSLLDFSSLAQSGRYDCVDQWKRGVLPSIATRGLLVMDCKDDCDLHLRVSSAS
ncbi:hypothetical protein EIP91_007945 [Steccherinum ochraceum]|uniref:Uncharacterized protein n=1 Tax=Steccherinum ochraceum TaxID=92696 RepID=A0A4R0R3J6_9APHY|nr:hypothetical protein EIP91_007945 [Steccherinum ochraceum]